MMAMKMNDLTKEELTILFLELNIAIRNWGEAKEYKDYPRLKDKLQSMIDNYCDHEWHPGGNRPWLHCIKCKANFNHEPYPY